MSITVTGLSGFWLDPKRLRYRLDRRSSLLSLSEPTKVNGGRHQAARHTVGEKLDTGRASAATASQSAIASTAGKALGPLVDQQTF